MTLKKVLGVILLLLGCLAGVSLLTSAPKNMSDAISKYDGSSHACGYVIGLLAGTITIAAIAFALIWFGLKFIKSATAPPHTGRF